jgi:hypothetical protein
MKSSKTSNKYIIAILVLWFICAFFTPATEYIRLKSPMQANIIYAMCLVCYFVGIGILYLFFRYKRYLANATLLFIGSGMPMTTGLDLRKSGHTTAYYAVFILCIAGTILAWYYIYKFISEKRVA